MINQNSNAKLFSLCLVAAGVLFASASEAHILVTPAGRMGTRDDAKFIQNNMANPTVADSPSPCSTYTTPMATRLQLQPGQNFTFTVQETINHPGRFFVQFRQDAAQNFWTPANQLARVEDPLVRGTTPVSFTVPTTPCDTCMIRVLQQMDEQPGEFYVQCYDVRIAASNPVATPLPGGGPSTLSANGDFKKPGFGCAMISDSSKPPGPGGPGGTGFAALITLVLMLMPLVVAFERRRHV